MALVSTRVLIEAHFVILLKCDYEIAIAETAIGYIMECASWSAQYGWH